MEPTQEEWRPVAGYEGAYEVSDRGRVRSLDRFIVNSKGVRQFLHGKVLAPAPKPRGYLFVILSANSRQRARHIHSLVAAAFIGPRPAGLDVCHNDGDKSDNRPGSLRYDTRSNNVLDEVISGRHHQTRKMACPKGHPYDLVGARGERRCSICRREQRKKAA